jgi:hypothetical protein
MDPDFKSARQVKLQQTPKPVEETFKTPDETAARDDLTVPAELPEVKSEAKDKAAKPSLIARLKQNWPPTKKGWIIIGIVSLLVICGIVALIMALSSSKPTPKASVMIPVKTVPKSATVASNLTGLQVAHSINQGPVTGVMIENSTEARPQSGLGQAGVVFEAVAEGGITRFLALFQDTAPANIGPIRSARPYYVEWAMGFDAGYAHVGGSPDALADIKAWNTRDLDEFYNGDSYHRVTTREAPHNVYTSIADLNQLEAKKGYTSSTYTSFPRKVAAPAKVPTAKTINMALSSAAYNVQYTYSPTTNSYSRDEGGAPQIDANTNAQISPQVVIAIVVPETQGALDASGAYYSDYASIGSGQAYVFEDGTVTTGQWAKSSPTSQITFTSSAGSPIKLNPGQTWITTLSSSSELTYTP